MSVYKLVKPLIIVQGQSVNWTFRFKNPTNISNISEIVMQGRINPDDTETVFDWRLSNGKIVKSDSNSGVMSFNILSSETEKYDFEKCLTDCWFYYVGGGKKPIFRADVELVKRISR